MVAYTTEIHISDAEMGTIERCKELAIKQAKNEYLDKDNRCTYSDGEEEIVDVILTEEI